MLLRFRNFFGARSPPGARSAGFPHALDLIYEGRLELALIALQEALAAEPGHAEAWYKQGNVLKDLNRPQEALLSYQRAVELDPQHNAAHCNAGVVLLALGRPDEALLRFQQVIANNPHDRIAHYNRGVAEQTLDLSAAALASYGRALDLDPNYAEAYYSRARLHEASSRWHEALCDYDRTLALRPGLAQAQLHRGNVLARLKRWEQALVSFDKAVSDDPMNLVAHLHRGNVLRELRHWDAAVANYDRVIAVEPNHADAHYNRAIVFELRKDFKKALRGFERAIAIRPDFVAAHYNRALVLLQTEEVAAGFEYYEWRWKNRGTGFDPAAYHGAVPLWTGRESLEGRRILVFSEQGLGDTLQFCRYIKMLAGRGANVVFEVQAPLLSLLRKIEGASAVIARGEPIPPCDAKCALMSLPLAFKTTLDTIPATRQYLHAEPATVTTWQAQLGIRTRPRIGLAWSGSPEYPNDERRSIPLAALIDRLPREFDYFCLQKDIRAEDRATLDASPFITQLAADMPATAALCECMDLVISSCTSIAHLAGALGRPLWILLAYNADWRWLEDRDDSPWYPTAKLYRQDESGDWGGVAACVERDLRRIFATSVDHLLSPAG
jgi:tetratricopeptide (TPR) repeat protein